MIYTDFPGAPKPIWFGNRGDEITLLANEGEAQPVVILTSVPRGIPDLVIPFVRANSSRLQTLDLYAKYYKKEKEKFLGEAAQLDGIDRRLQALEGLSSIARNGVFDARISPSPSLLDIGLTGLLDNHPVTIVSAPIKLLDYQGAFSMSGQTQAPASHSSNVLHTEMRTALGLHTDWSEGLDLRPAARARVLPRRFKRRPRASPQEDDELSSDSDAGPLDDSDYIPKKARAAGAKRAKSDAKADVKAFKSLSVPNIGEFAALFFEDEPQLFGIGKRVSHFVHDGDCYGPKCFGVQLYESRHRFTGYTPLETKEGKPYINFYSPDVMITTFHSLVKGDAVPEEARAAITSFVQNEALDFSFDQAIEDDGDVAMTSVADSSPRRNHSGDLRKRKTARK